MWRRRLEEPRNFSSGMPVRAAKSSAAGASPRSGRNGDSTGGIAPRWGVVLAFRRPGVWRRRGSRGPPNGSATAAFGSLTRLRRGFAAPSRRSHLGRDHQAIDEGLGRALVGERDEQLRSRAPPKVPFTRRSCASSTSLSGRFSFSACWLSSWTRACAWARPIFSASANDNASAMI